MNPPPGYSEWPVAQMPARSEANHPRILTPDEIAGLIGFLELLDVWDRKGTEEST